MAGITNSWIGTTVTDSPQTCNGSSSTIMGSAGNCILWIIVGLIIGSLQFEKNK